MDFTCLKMPKICRLSFPPNLTPAQRFSNFDMKFEDMGNEELQKQDQRPALVTERGPAGR